MTSPSSMLVPDHCVRKGQHLTFDDSWTWSYLRGVWEKFSGTVTISIINLSHMCAYSAILRLKIINNKSIKLSKIPRTWHLRKGGSEWDNRPHWFQKGRCCAIVTNQSILPRILCISDIYIYIGEWSERYGYIYIGSYIYSSGGGRRLPAKPYFFSFFIFHSQHCLRMCVPCC